jgi:hypothetical protein
MMVHVMSLPVLTEEEYQKDRSPDELYAWLFEKIDLFASRSQHDRCFREQVLLHDGLFKKFHEEIYPLAIFAKRWYGGREDIRLRPNLGCHNYDAEMIDRSDATISWIEITQVFFDEDEYHRMEYYLDERRRDPVCGTGPVHCEGTKRTGHRITVEDGCWGEEDRQKYREFVCDRISKKAGKPYGHYKPNTSLIVAVDDYVKVVSEDSQKLLNEAVASVVASPTWPFARTFVVGIAQRCFGEFPTETGTFGSG